MKQHKKSMYKEVGHDYNFKPTKQVPQPVKAAYEHLTDYKSIDKCRKGPDGAVIIESRNFLTNPPKVGIVGKQ